MENFKTMYKSTKLKTLKLLNSKTCYTGCLFLTGAPLKAPKCQITKKIPWWSQLCFPGNNHQSLSNCFLSYIFYSVE